MLIETKSCKVNFNIAQEILNKIQVIYLLHNKILQSLKIPLNSMHKVFYYSFIFYNFKHASLNPNNMKTLYTCQDKFYVFNGSHHPE